MINKYPQLSFVFDRRKIASPTVKASVELRICYAYKQKFISTGIKLYSTQWKKGKIVNCPDIFQISQTLDSLIADVRQIILDMEKEKNMDISSITKRLEAKKQMGISFQDFCRQRAEIRKYGKSPDTKERYDRFLRLFNKWGGIKKYEDITEAKIIAYDSYLKASGMKACSIWNNYHRFINSFINDAVDAGIIKSNPYKWVNISREKSIGGIGKYLSFEEFDRIKNSSLPTACLEKVRDLFVFQTYTCMSFSDMKDFDIDKIKTVKGMRVYTGNRKKTNKEYAIPISLSAWEILNKYHGKLPIISNVKYNVYLKAVAQHSGVDKPVSSHWARHTGATLLLNKGVSMGIISKICGHSSTRITEQIYAKLLEETVVDAVTGIEF